MVEIGLTGGIGAGKSTVARLLAERGAVVIDADQLAREAVAPGTPGLAAVVAMFGPEVLRDDGTLDRAALAALVFADGAARGRLEAVVHPEVARLTDERRRATPPDAVVVHDVPLLAERGHHERYDLVVVVEAPVDQRLQRLVGRGLTPADARARIAAQAGDEERRAVADVVVVNDGGLDALTAQVDALWEQILGLSSAPGPVGPTS